jgi:hypothetical protein
MCKKIDNISEINDTENIVVTIEREKTSGALGVFVKDPDWDTI